MTTSVNDVANKTFDIVIAGGGTAGLTLAARLTEDPSVTVAVIEAGEANLSDPNIDFPAQFGKTFGNPKYDYGFQTTKQKFSNDNIYLIPSGKGLGGSSALNYYSWIKPPAGDVDAFEKLGNPGWNWEDFKKYSRFSESFKPATGEEAEMSESDYPGLGKTGPIQIRTLPHFTTVEELIQDSLVQKGLKKIDNPYEGDINGTWWSCGNLDSDWKRSYAATAYYLPNKDRLNLTVLTEATVSRVLFANSEQDHTLTASGLEFLHDGKTYTVNAHREVILSAGNTKSPQILELSGIGRKEILSAIDVDIKVDLPGVGENVQDHLHASIIYELDPKTYHETFDLMRDPEYAAAASKLLGEGKGLARNGITSFSYFNFLTANPTEFSKLTDRVSREIDTLKGEGKLPPGHAEQFDIQLETLRDANLPDCEIIGFPGLISTHKLTPHPKTNYVSMTFVNQHPFSRGSIHATNKDPYADPEMDPHYFERDFDLENMVQQFKFIRSLAESEPWKSNTKEIDPGPACHSDEQIRNYIKEHLRTTYHAIGSCSMLPRDKRGVVDHKLKVYGTTNLRVVDVSIVPLHVAAHTQTLAYAIGEKGEPQPPWYGEPGHTDPPIFRPYSI